ncbi:hypothetical protein MKW98_026922 [Papaver atlanticum]|uniref:Uncharacterized protein n=1 Tax=Papaver atlanticum TaxID=357466 RepID=A0AAD4SVG7_9MAGN|nr:hypothetical protein MKW98_026922 [Papaver atlanticum]
MNGSSSLKDELNLYGFRLHVRVLGFLLSHEEALAPFSCYIKPNLGDVVHKWYNFNNLKADVELIGKQEARS